MIEGINELVVGIKELVLGIILAAQGYYKIVTTLMQGVLLLLAVLIILYLTSVASKALISLFKYLEEKSQKKESLWNALVTAIQKPVALIVWIVGASIALKFIQFATNAEIFAIVPIIGSIAIIAVLAWFLFRLVENLKKSYIQKMTACGETYNQVNLDTLVNVLRFAIVITAALIAMQMPRFSLVIILVFGGVGVIAVGFAIKELISNFLKQ